MSNVSRDMATEVQTRARDRCEYCLMHQSLQGATFHVEHIHPSSRGGPSTLDNLAWCCPTCNGHKADRTHAPDPETGQPEPLYNPRLNAWSTHFEWHGYAVRPLTPIGRATVALLHFNHPRKRMIRQAEQRFGLFPPLA